MDYNNGNNSNDINNNSVNSGNGMKNINYQTFNNPSVSAYQANNNFDMPASQTENVNSSVKTLTPEERAKIDNIFNSRSKNEKIGYYGLLISGVIVLICIIFALIVEDIFLPVMIAIIVGFGLMVFLVMYLVAFIKRKNLLKRKDIDIIKSELKSDNLIVLEHIGLYLTQNYIVSHGAYSNILNYQDIALIYNERRVVRSNGIPVDAGLFAIAVLKNGKKVNLIRSYDEEAIRMAEELILQHNNQIMMGLSKENNARLKEMKREYKNSNK